MTVLLALENISKQYSDSQDTLIDVLKGLSLQVSKGESVAITGPSGSGKSTLLNLIGILDRPTSGKIIFDGCDLGALTPKAEAGFRNQKIGFIFQLHHLLPQCTVMENVLLPALPSGKAGDRSGQAESLLKRVGLGNRMHRMPGQLSGGERQRVAVVRALINSPQLLLADEPTGSLDETNARQLGELLVTLNGEGTALILVTHDQALASMMHTVYRVHEGSLVPQQ